MLKTDKFQDIVDHIINGNRNAAFNELYLMRKHTFVEFLLWLSESHYSDLTVIDVLNGMKERCGRS